jgi:hypothetical protein
MARVSPKSLSLTGLLIVFFLVISVGMIFFGKSRIVNGFEDMSSCEQGLRPCPEGFFCEKTQCIPIYPKMNIDTVNGF